MEQGEKEVAVRERLLTAALQRFRRQGYAATSVREIVEAAGVTKPVLYYYFGSKEKLYLELMEGTFTTFQQLLRQYLSTEGNARERIVGLCTGLFDAFEENREVVHLIYSIFFGPPQGAPAYPLEQYFNSLLLVFSDLVREGMTTGELREAPVADVAWAIISIMNTFMEEQLCPHPPRVGRADMVRVLTLVLNGVGGCK